MILRETIRTNDSKVAAALSHAARGWPVFPVWWAKQGHCACPKLEACVSPAKHPLTDHGFKDATTDDHQIARWWRRWPEANIGIRTGVSSALVVLDIDPKAGGEDSLAELAAKDGPLPETIEVLTGGGGRHLYLRHPGGKAEIRNSAGKLGGGLDVRADGGFVVGPGSIHVSGREYTWGHGSSPNEVEIDDLPGWMLTLLIETADVEHSETLVAGGDIPEGKRNDALTSLGGSMRRRGMGEAAIAAALLEENRDRCRPRLPDEEVRRIAGSVMRYDGSNVYRPAKVYTNGSKPGPVDGDDHLTDLGNAKRLVVQHGENFRYCYAFKSFLVFDGARWRPDDVGQMAAWAKETVMSIYAEAAELYTRAAAAQTAGDEEKAQSYEKKAGATWGWAVKSEAAPRIAAMIELAKSESGIPIMPSDLDTDPWLLNMNNGTVNLRSGELRQHQREDLITKLCPVEYDPGASLPLWDRFLGEAIPDYEVRRYIQKCCGATLAGVQIDDIIILIHGPGGTGKSTFREALLATLGSYGATADLETFTTRNAAHSAQPDLARLQGRRLVAVSEVEGKKGGSMSLLKRASGGDTVQARFLYGSTFEFTPAFTLWIVANERPRVSDLDSGIWRRIREIPFTQKFQEPDPTIRQKLKTPEIAGDAILAWAVRGCLEWQLEGLTEVPEAIVDATAEYRRDMNPLAEWLEERTQEAPEAWTHGKVLFEDYKMWAEGEGIKRPLGQKSFSQRIGEYFTAQREGRQGQRGFSGIELR